MTDLVSTTEARSHLRLDTVPSGSPDDVWLAVFIPAISEAVLGWLKDAWRAYVPMEDSSGILVDSNGDPIPALPLTAKPVVKAAVLLELGNVFRFREGEGVDNVPDPSAGWGYTLNKTSTALLSGIRKSTLK
jgi:hypothetical protein